MRGVWLTVGPVVVVFAAVGLATALRPAAGASDAARAAQERLSRLPLTIGNWTGTAAVVPANHLRVAEADAHLSRVYTHARTGEAVTLLILAGRPGPLGAHTPETCFAGAGFAQLGPAEAVSVPGGELWRATFASPTTPPAFARVMWGWGAGDGAWAAADDPRTRFAGRELVYKLYAARRLPAGPPPAGPTDPVDEFLLAVAQAFAALP